MIDDIVEITMCWLLERKNVISNVMNKSAFWSIAFLYGQQICDGSDILYFFTDISYISTCVKSIDNRFMVCGIVFVMECQNMIYHS